MWNWLTSTKGKVTYLAGLVAAIVVGMLVFGFDRQRLFLIAAIYNVVLGGAALVSLFRTAPTGAHSSPLPDHDWLAQGSVEVQVSGTGKRYRAEFSTVRSPIDEADRETREIAETLTFLGLPEATVTRLPDDAPTPEPSDESIGVIEIPAQAVHDAVRARR